MNKSPYLDDLQLKAELDRCLSCPAKPCMYSCPVHCCPQEFIKCAKEGDYAGAIKSITSNNPMGLTCGLICPEQFCIKACVRAKIDRPVRIPAIQAALVKKYRQKTSHKIPCSQRQSIAIVGAGPAGIAAAWALVQAGYKATIFEKSAHVGGALRLIPSARLPEGTIEDDWSYIQTLGEVSVCFNSTIDDPVALLKQEFAGVIMAIGDEELINLNIPGEEHIVPYTEYLAHPQRYARLPKIAIIGGGKVAFDCAMTAIDNHASDVTMLVRRALSDMKIDPSELQQLQQAKVHIEPMTKAACVQKEDKGYTLETISTTFVQGQWQEVPDSRHKRTGFDLIIKAIGSKSKPHITHPQVIYAGDCKNEGSTIVEALASGIKAADIITTTKSS